MTKEKFQPGGILSGETFTLDEQFLSYKNAYGKAAMVPRESIQTVVIDAKGWGTSILKIIGHDTELVSIKMPHDWAVKTQKWLIERLKPNTAVKEPVKNIEEEQPVKVGKPAKKTGTVSKIASIFLVILGTSHIITGWSVLGILAGVVLFIAAMVISPSFSELWQIDNGRPLSRKFKVNFVIACLVVSYGLISFAVDTEDNRAAEKIVGEAMAVLEQGDLENARRLINEAKAKYSNKEANKAIDMEAQIAQSESEEYAKEILVGMVEDEVALLQQGRLDKQYFSIKYLNDRFLSLLRQELPMRQAHLESKKLEEELLQAARKAEERREKIESQFSVWDGAHHNLVRAVKKVMNDPGSFEHIETVWWDMKDHLVVRMTFRGTNAFGAVVPQTVKAWVDLEGNMQKWEWYN